TEFTVPLLQRCGLLEWFDTVVCGDTCARKKPDPMPLLHACERLGCQPEEALAIGDSVNDALAARAAGITVLAVPYGYNEGMDIQSLDIDDIVSGIDDAAAWLTRRAPVDTESRNQCIPIAPRKSFSAPIGAGGVCIPGRDDIHSASTHLSWSADQQKRSPVTRNGRAFVFSVPAFRRNQEVP